ncbi:family 16 glycoside hydrolase [Arthrobacter sp. SAFR-179]|uniref:family 16 glycoside hydrolase n=1 Tax=Arthrobacter sp. SAFR-179 TaxID=3387279 RepID=UPI003F7BA201
MTDVNAGSTFLPLDRLPGGASLRSVTAFAGEIEGRKGLRVGLTGEAAAGVPGVDYIDQPTFVLLPAAFENGVIEVDILSRLTADAPDYARAFAGIAYRISDDADRFESVYVRPLNGAKLNPPGPRVNRGVQYFAYPEWDFERLRVEYPDGRYEARADIGPDEWMHLRVEVEDQRLRVGINGVEALAGAETKAMPASGKIGLWVDIGTEAFFSNLSITRG